MNVAVQPLSELWWGGLISSTSAIIFLLLLFKKSLKSYQLLFMKSLSIMLFFSWIYGHYNAMFISNSWSLEYNLPLHL